MKIRRSLSVVAMAFVASVVALPACGGGEDAKSAKVTAGEMPAGESWTGVYYHQVYGYLHMQEQDSNVVARWKRTDQSAWGELSGTRSGNVLHFTWKEHKYGLPGPAGESKGKGYFQYKLGKEGGIAELDGQYGLNNDETGSEWHCVKQQRMAPDLKSISGDTGSSSGPAPLD